MSFSGFREMVDSTESQRRTFFKMAFGPHSDGWICICFKEHASGQFDQLWFHYPSQIDEMLTSVQERAANLSHFWFASALYKTRGDRHKSNIKYSTFSHADLDECNPQLLLVKPSILVESSPGRHQALWVYDKPVTPQEAEQVNTKICYYHRDQGADTCQDAGHLLRIPYTMNYKYGTIESAPVVAITYAERKLYRIKDFADYPIINALKFTEQQHSVPDLPQRTADEIITYYQNNLPNKFFLLKDTEPDSDQPDSKWSGSLYNLMSICIEAGMKREETFIVAREARCNKFARDGRGDISLWQDVIRTYVKHLEKMQLIPNAGSKIPDLLTDEEIRSVQVRITFIEKYIAWAKELTDAPIQYHQASAFVILSAILSGNVCLPTSHEKVSPNLWFMILAGTTLTRKSTAMRFGMGLLRDVDERAEMATDGSIEGILSGLRDRPGQPSIFLRDEFTGLLDAIANKDYMAGFAEQMTKLYDGDNIKRLLRKETIEVKDPRFIVFAGGIKDKTQMLLTEEHIMSGFIPRFVFISGDADPDRIKLTSPPGAQESDDQRELLRNELHDLLNHYVQPKPIVKDDKIIGSVSSMFEANMTPEAWARYNAYEKLMMDTALSTGIGYMMPVYVRLTVSTLKAAILIAAAQNRTQGLMIEEIDILHAIYYAQSWRKYASEIVTGVGKTYDERLIDRIYEYVQNSPMGVSRAELMTVFMLDMRRAELMFGTMQQRNMVYAIEVSGQRRYRPIKETLLGEH